MQEADSGNRRSTTFQVFECRYLHMDGAWAVIGNHGDLDLEPADSKGMI